MKNKRKNQKLAMFLVALCLSLIQVPVTARPVDAAVSVTAGTSYKKAATLKTGVTYSQTMSKTNYRQYYKFVLTKPGLVSVTVKHGAYASFYNENAFIMDFQYTSTGDYTYQQAIRTKDTTMTTEITALPAGTYYIYLYGKEAYRGKSFQMKINYTQKNYIESQDTVTDQKLPAMKNKQNYYGTAYGSDADRFKVKMTSNGYLSLNLKHDTVPGRGGTKFYVLTIYNSAGTMLGKYNIYGDDKNYTCPKLGLGKGTYYIELFAEGNTCYKGLYQLKATMVKTSGWESEDNNTIQKADPLTIGKTIKGQCWSYAYYDTDYYKFSVKSTTYVKINLKHTKFNTSDGILQVGVCDAKGKSVTGLWQEGNKGSSTTEKIKLKKGTYYISVQAMSKGYGREYSLTVSKTTK